MKKIKPYELPAEFAGFVIVRLRCPVCEREFTTAIRLDNFLGNPGGSFLHYPEDGGCNSWFTIIDSEGPFVIARVHNRRDLKRRQTIAFYVGVGEVGIPTDPNEIGWKQP